MFGKPYAREAKCAADGDSRVRPASSYRVVLDVDDDFLIIPCPFTYITMSVRTDKSSACFFGTC